MFPRPLVWPPSTMRWVRTSSKPLHPSCQWTWGFLGIKSRDLLGVWSVLGDIGVGSTLLACQSWPWQILSLIRPSSGLGLIPQPYPEMSPTSFLEIFFFGLGLILQSPAVASSPFSLEWAASDFQVESFLLITEMTQLGPPSSAKVLSGGTTTED